MTNSPQSTAGTWRPGVVSSEESQSPSPRHMSCGASQSPSPQHVPSSRWAASQSPSPRHVEEVAPELPKKKRKKSKGGAIVDEKASPAQIVQEPAAKKGAPAGSRAAADARSRSRGGRNADTGDKAKMCTKCGVLPQSMHKKVRKGLCCNNCPNHGPLCTSKKPKQEWQLNPNSGGEGRPGPGRRRLPKEPKARAEAKLKQIEIKELEVQVKEKRELLRQKLEKDRKQKKKVEKEKSSSSCEQVEDRRRSSKGAADEVDDPRRSSKGADLELQRAKVEEDLRALEQALQGTGMSDKDIKSAIKKKRESMLQAISEGTLEHDVAKDKKGKHASKDKKTATISKDSSQNVKQEEPPEPEVDSK